MATQYRDGTFSDTEPFSDALEKFLEGVEAGEAKAFHVGTPTEIDNVKEEAKVLERMTQLENQVADIQARRSDILAIPDRICSECYHPAECAIGCSKQHCPYRAAQ